MPRAKHPLPSSAEDEQFYTEEFEISESDDEDASPQAMQQESPVGNVLEEPNDILEFNPSMNTPPFQGGLLQNSDTEDKNDDIEDGDLWPFTSLEANDKKKVRICRKPFLFEDQWTTEQMTKEAFRTFVLDQTRLLIWLAERRLIANESYCLHCPRPISMLLQKEISHGDNYNWRCRKCSKRATLRVRSVFDKLKSSLDILVYLMYMWTHGYSFEEMCAETGASPNVISTFLNRLRAHLKRETDRLEGVIEIAEGAYLDPPRICALAGVERFGNKCFLIRLPQERCNQKLLIRFIRHRVMPGSTIITSDWPGYRPLGDLPEGYAHLVADPERNVTIQKADELLEQLAIFIDEMQTDCREQFSSILDEFVWRRVCTEGRLDKVCYILSHLYNVS
ncbi:unnamed protein product [Echinostoma caproni]|uniref:DDE_Tnp_IS1595 domain-containing protein n=1 Tax=Echinostoma caproni TaxID=27848 RepID=A0A183AJT4_9TREM|nr:unnamed protein product [Echinostoma caproni]